MFQYDTFGSEPVHQVNQCLIIVEKPIPLRAMQLSNRHKTEHSNERTVRKNERIHCRTSKDAFLQKSLERFLQGTQRMIRVLAGPVNILEKVHITKQGNAGKDYHTKPHGKPHPYLYIGTPKIITERQKPVHIFCILVTVIQGQSYL